MGDPDPHRSCSEKHRYGTEDVATSVATKVQLDRGVALRVYACTYCGGYHLTKLNVAAPKPGFRPAKLSKRAMAELRERGHGRMRKR